MIRSRLPNEYLPDLVEATDENTVREIIESHFISPAAFAVLLKDPFTPQDFETFLTERQRTIREAIEDLLVKSRLDLPPRLRELDAQIEDVELNLRRLVATKLQGHPTMLPSHVGSEWVIGPRLVRAANQLDSADPALCIDGFCPRLITCHECVHLLDIARGQIPLSSHESENTLYRGLMILDHGSNRFRLLIVHVWDERRIDSPLDQQLRNATVERIQALDKTGLNGPLAVQSFVEPYERIQRLQPLALFQPDCRQVFQLWLYEILWVRLVVGDEVPSVTHAAE